MNGSVSTGTGPSRGLPSGFHREPILGQSQRSAQQQTWRNPAHPTDRTRQLQNGNDPSLPISQLDGHQSYGHSTNHTQQNPHNEALHSPHDALRPQYEAHTNGLHHNPTTLSPPDPQRSGSQTAGQPRRTPSHSTDVSPPRTNPQTPTADPAPSVRRPRTHLGAEDRLPQPRFIDTGGRHSNNNNPLQPACAGHVIASPGDEP